MTFYEKNNHTIMKKFYETLYVADIYPLPIEPGIYRLEIGDTIGYRCGCGGYCERFPEFVINYGQEVGCVYACDLHAEEKLYI